MKFRYFFLLFNLLIGWILAGCSGSQNNVSQSHYNHYQYADLGINLSKEASETCSDIGGIPTLTKQLNGSHLPVCLLVNGRRCNEQALLDSGCVPI
ncbi:DUF333 domain-containing protein [Xenorhabdus nematophila]|uniref:putative hemolysin n=1 Tax=Xenorhabdus nematophila TaxID=628 RepID=UPI00054338D6|nr:DUF333 domain-containing protein [Xenorhabdus nematophila]CEF30908.1 conserved hypothetical protein [Xenorhabdus nematophila str. Websteri]AYA40052.1 DUF333 domain-containing protein [Xenorhabdus nematophila]MBA0018697.1 DUF333 domain-containing protein [Xenorhabdus nematophila]MCB4426681.1 DUF333 domain-containing protein [Xenorhabdus nematophila]QNJ37697.1 DUF333 domain-containing protein [Xenorhabdus nematophila]